MGLNLKAKTTLLILIIALILSGTSITISNVIISGIVKETYRDKAENLAKTVSLMVDANAAARLKHEVMDI